MKELETTDINSLISKWEIDALPRITREQSLTRVDTTDTELHASKKLDADETFVGTKVIDVNIKRELPQIFSFLTESSRFLLFRGLPAPKAKALEEWFATTSRDGQWIVPHLQVYYAGAIHGVAFVEIVADDTNPLGTRVEFVPPEEMVYNQNAKDLQTQGLVARKFIIPVTFLREFGEKLAFTADEMLEIEERYATSIWEAITTLYKVYYRKDGVVQCRWYSKEISKFMSPEYLHVSGAYGEDGKPIPSKQYPFRQFRYTMTSDTLYGKMQGRAAYDEPLQVSIQALSSAYVNGAIRASGFYPYVDGAGADDGNTVKQLAGIALQHNRVASHKLSVFQPTYPSADMLSALQLFRTQASNDAGQTNYATVTKRMTNTTATEIAASTEQARLMSSVGVSMVAMYIFGVESYRFDVFRANVAAHKKMPPEFSELLSKVVVASVIDQQFKSRDQRLAAAKDWLGKLVGTPAFAPFLLEILKDDLPQYQELIAHAMAGNEQAAAQVGKAMLELLKHVAEASPEFAQDPNYVKILNAAQSIYGGAGNPPSVGGPTGNPSDASAASDAGAGPTEPSDQVG